MSNDNIIPINGAGPVPTPPTPQEVFAQWPAVDDAVTSKWDSTFGRFSAQQPTQDQVFQFLLTRTTNMAIALRALHAVLMLYPLHVHAPQGEQEQP